MQHPKTQRWQTWVQGPGGELRNILAFNSESEAQANLVSIEAKLNENKSLSLANLQGEFQDNAPVGNTPESWTPEAIFSISQAISLGRVRQIAK